MHFTEDNTDGYTAEQLRVANNELSRRVAVAGSASQDFNADDPDATAADWIKREAERVLLWVESLPHFRALTVASDPVFRVERVTIAEQIGVEFVMSDGSVVAMKYNANAGGLQVRTPEGTLEILPDCSNSIIVKVNRRW